MTIKKIIKQEQDKIATFVIGGLMALKSFNRAINNVSDDIKRFDVDEADKKIEKNKSLLSGQDKDKVNKLSNEILELEDKKKDFKEYIDLLENIEKTEDAIEKNAMSWNDLDNCANEVINTLYDKS